MKVPIYQPVRSVPSRKGPRVSTQRNPAFDIIQQRAQEKLKELDTAQALDSFNAFRDEGRTALGEMLQKKGVDAVGAAESHKTWLDKRMKVYEEKQLAGASQKTQFKDLVLKYRSGNLNQLARHEAQEHFLRKKQTERNLLAGFMDDAAATPEKTEEYAALFKAQVDELNPGIDKSGEKMAGAGSIRVSAIEAAIRDNPDTALKMIDAWQDVEGMNAYDLTSLRNRAENAVKKNVTTGAYWKLKTMFPNDPEGAAEYLDNEENTKAIGIETIQQQQYLINLFEAEQTQKENQEKEDTIAARDNESNLIAEALRRNDMKTAMDTVENSTVLTEVEKLEYESGFATAKKTVTDTVLKADIIARIAGKNITHKAQYMIYKDNGLTAQDVQEIDQIMDLYQSDPEQAFYVRKANESFNVRFGDNTDWEPYKPEFEIAMHKAIITENLRGADIWTWANKYMGIIDNPWFGGPRLQSEFGKQVEAIREGTPEPEQPRFRMDKYGEPIPGNVAGIPENDLKVIHNWLNDHGLELTENNILRAYNTDRIHEKFTVTGGK